MSDSVLLYSDPLLSPPWHKSFKALTTLLLGFSKKCVTLPQGTSSNFQKITWLKEGMRADRWVFLLWDINEYFWSLFLNYTEYLVKCSYTRGGLNFTPSLLLSRLNSCSMRMYIWTRHNLHSGFCSFKLLRLHQMEHEIKVMENFAVWQVRGSKYFFTQTNDKSQKIKGRNDESIWNSAQVEASSFYSTSLNDVSQAIWFALPM